MSKERCFCGAWNGEGSLQCGHCNMYRDGVRAGHLEALREVEKVYYEAPALRKPDVVPCADIARRRLAKKRRMG